MASGKLVVLTCMAILVIIVCNLAAGLLPQPTRGDNGEVVPGIQVYKSYTPQYVYTERDQTSNANAPSSRFRAGRNYGYGGSNIARQTSNAASGFGGTSIASGSKK